MFTLNRDRNEAAYIEIPMRTVANPETCATGKSPTYVAYYKDAAGAWNTHTIAASFSEIGSTGVYALTLTAAEANHDQIMLKVSATDCVDVVVDIYLKSLRVDAGDVVLATSQPNYAPAKAGDKMDWTDVRLENFRELATPTNRLAAPSGVDYGSVIMVTTDAAYTDWPDGLQFLLEYYLPRDNSFSRIGVFDKTGWQIDAGAGSIASEDGGLWYLHNQLPDGTPNPAYPTIPAGTFTISYDYNGLTYTASCQYRQIELSSQYAVGHCFFFPDSGDIGLLWGGGKAWQVVGEEGTVTVGGYSTGMAPKDQILVNPANKLLTDSNGYVTDNNYTSSSPGASQYV